MLRCSIINNHFNLDSNMAFKDILVYIDEGDSNQERVNTAFNMAKMHNARLTGITLSALQPDHLKIKESKAVKNISLKEAEKRMEVFAEQAKKEGIEADARIIKGNPTKAAAQLAKVARNYDIVILRQANPNNRNHSVVEIVAESVILMSGRPVFFMPYIGAHRIPCKNAMIAWDGTPACTRSVHDALPILSHIDNVVILVVQEGKQKTAKGELLVDDLAKHLQRHGTSATIKRVNAGTFDVPTVILNEIAENDVDLMVMGGYGTPSLKQKIFGGVTRTILSSMIIPVVMSH
jgi:nucleotide-binding universal stress UspA family protein